MRDPQKPDTQADEYLPDLKYPHKQRSEPSDVEGVNPRDTSSMPRAEDDQRTWNGSVEYHDRRDVPEGGTAPAPPIDRD